MSFRPCVLVITALAACATASSQQPGTADAPSGHPDASPSGGDGMPPHIDAAGDAAIDAPPGSCATPFSGALATWSFTGESGSQAQTAATNMATGVSAGPVTRSSGLTVQSGVGSINSSGWPTAAALDPTKYYTFSVTPPTGCLMNLTNVSIDLKSSSSGPAKIAVATSGDSFTATTAATPNAVSTPALTVTNTSSAIEIRVYGYMATATTGTLRIQNTLSLNGALH